MVGSSEEQKGVLSPMLPCRTASEREGKIERFRGFMGSSLCWGARKDRRGLKPLTPVYDRVRKGR